MITTRSLPPGGLYYPYIHIQDPDWLRANLLIFPYVERMVPLDFTPRDSQVIREFTAWEDGQAPLLRSAALFTDRSLQAQAVLAKRLERDKKRGSFLRQYGKETARKLVDENAYGFQIHAAKLSPELRAALRTDDKLAWEPLNREVYDTDSGYIEVHPRVGEAVMSTLAIACAQGSGLDIVGDRRSGALHRCLLDKNLDNVYKTWLDPSSNPAAPSAASGEELMEFILGIPGDLSTLTAAKLRQIAAEREPIDKLLEALRGHAARIPAMDKGREREEAFRQAADEVMSKWESDRKNLSGFARAFFGLDSVKLATDFASEIAEKTLAGSAGGAVTTATTTAAAAGSTGAGWLGSLAAGGIIGAGAGLVIGLIAHAGTTYHALHRREKDSPYRFLTTLKEAGVVFQFAPRQRLRTVSRSPHRIAEEYRP